MKEVNEAKTRSKLIVADKEIWWAICCCCADDANSWRLNCGATLVIKTSIHVQYALNPGITFILSI